MNSFKPQGAPTLEEHPKFNKLTELFEYIWISRPHRSELSGKPLVGPQHPQFIWQFAHVLSKGSHPRFKLNPNNIILMTIEEHMQQTNTKLPEPYYTLFNNRAEELKRAYHQG